MVTDIIQIGGMSLNNKIMIIIRMITSGTIVMIQVEKRIDKTLIEGMIAIIGIKILLHLEKTVTGNNIEGVVIRKTANRIIGHPTRNLISQKHLGNFNMISKGRTQISTKLVDHNMNMVRLVVHQSKIATFAGKMAIMQTNVQLGTRGKHLLLIWWLPRFNRSPLEARVSNQNGKSKTLFEKQLKNG